jgi:hypothetical protein
MTGTATLVIVAISVAGCGGNHADTRAGSPPAMSPLDISVFRITKTDDLDLRPIYHYLENRVRAHVLICVLAAYLTWHLRQALAELTYTDQDIPPADDPVAPAQRSAQAKTKDATKRNTNNLPVHKYQDLLNHLATLDRQTILFTGQKIEKLTSPTPVQRRAFELLGAPVPLTLQ